MERRASDVFLLNVAQISAALVGLFLVGMLLNVETGFGRTDHHAIVRAIAARFDRGSS